MNRMSAKHLLMSACAVALVFVGFVMVSRAYTLHRAKGLVAEIENFDRAPDPTVAFLSFTKKYQRYLADKNCDREFCQYQFIFTNRPLPILHLARGAELEVILSVYQARLDAVALRLTSSVFRENSPTVYVQEDFCKGSTDIPCDHFAINPHGRNVMQTWNGTVEFGQVANDEQKRLAWAFNFDCLNALHGCRDISELMPALWKRVSPDSVSSRVRSTADSIAEATQPLPD